MINIINNLYKHIHTTIKEASTLFRFRNHVNSNTDSPLSSPNLNNDISNIITCKDLIYFTMLQNKSNDTYSVVNSIMLGDKITNVSVDAYKKQRQRKSSF
jgi:hypothetical protein